MFLRTLSVAGLLLALSAMPAAALSDDLNPSYEFDLYQVYNEIFGTSFTSSAGASAGVNNGTSSALITGGMDGLLVSPDSVFLSNPDAVIDSSAFFIARYAGQDQRFGYYEASGGPPTGSSVGGTGDFHHLFDVVGDTNVIITDPGFDPTILEPDSAAGGVTIPLGDFPIGFYLNSPLGGSVTWLSEAIYNPDGEDHLRTYRVVDADGNVVPDTFILAWEDRPLMGDMDHNDLVVQVFIPGSGTQIPLIPEPTTAGLLVLGLAAAAVRRRFTA